jgi:translation initiation factor IF-3
MVLAEEAGLDLVEISPNANPPVCKVMDFGKYKYEQQKREAEARRKQKNKI